MSQKEADCAYLLLSEAGVDKKRVLVNERVMQQLKTRIFTCDIFRIIITKVEIKCSVRLQDSIWIK